MDAPAHPQEHGVLRPGARRAQLLGHRACPPVELAVRQLSLGGADRGGLGCELGPVRDAQGHGGGVGRAHGGGSPGGAVGALRGARSDVIRPGRGSGAQRRAGGCAGGLGEAGGDARGGGRLEEVADVQPYAEFGADAAGQAGGEERVASVGEEVVVHAGLLEAEDGGEDLADRLLGGRDRQPSGRSVHGGRVGERLAVELAVDGERELRQVQEQRRDHVVGEGAAQLRADLLGAGRPGEVADEALLARVVPVDGDDGLADTGHGAQRGLHLAELDAVAADLDLVVLAAEEVELAVGPHPGEVAGAVHPAAGDGGERVGDVALAGAARVAQVAGAHAGAADEEFAGHAGRYGGERGVQQVEGVVAQRASDGQSAVFQLGVHVGADEGVGVVVGALGEAVGVDDRGLRVAGVPAGAQFGRQDLAVDDEPAQLGQGRWSTPVSHRSTAARTKEGTVSRTVIPRRAASSKRAAGSRAVSRVTRWTCPPVISGASICHTEMSKVSGAFITTRSPSPRPRSSTLDSRWLFMPRRWTMAPLGLPVEPEVKQT